MIPEVRAIYESKEELTPCEAWTALFHLRKKDAERWASSAYFVGLVAALALAAAILVGVLGQNGAAITSVIGTILSGAGTAWLWSRRTEVQDEAEEFLMKVNEFCPTESKSHEGEV